MSHKSTRIIYRGATGIVTVIVLMYTGNSIFNNLLFTQRFADLGYPTYLIYPLTIAMLLGLVAIWSGKSKTLKEWAYAGFFFNFLLAFAAELHAIDGDYFSSPVAIVALLTSFLFDKKLTEKPFSVS